MGLWSSKQQQQNEIKVNRADIESIGITEEALESLKRTFEIHQNQNKAPVQEEVQKSQPQQQPALYTEINSRLDEYEQRLVDSFNKASKEVEDLFVTRYKTMPICVDLQKNVVECLNSNSKYPLKCSELSNKFLKCVEEERQSRFSLAPKKQSTPNA